MAGATSFDVYTEDPASYVYSTLIRYEDGSTQSIDPDDSTLELIRRIDAYAKKHNVELEPCSNGLIINGTKYIAKVNHASTEVRRLARNYIIDSSLPLSAVGTTDGSLIFIGAPDLYEYLSLRRA